MTVLIAGNRITDLGKTRNTKTPKDVQGNRCYREVLIPGLWDMHVHPHGEQDLPLFLANGVTGIRIMWGYPEFLEWRKEIDAGRLLAPHLWIASPIIDGPKPFWPGSVSVGSEAAARQAVDIAKASGADFVKVYTFFRAKEYFAIADEARKQGIPFEGHVPMAVSAQEASNAGQKSFEHLTGILPACSTESEKLNQAAEADLSEYLTSDNHQFEGPRVHALRGEMLATCSPETAAPLFALLKKNGTWQTPTLTLWHMFSSIDDPQFTNDPR